MLFLFIELFKKVLFTLDIPFWRDTATDENVTKSLWLKQLFSKLYYYFVAVLSNIIILTAPLQWKQQQAK